MAQYIDKDALVAEINRLLAFYSKEIEDNKEDPWAMDIAKRDILQEVLSFLSTLEVKEVGLDALGVLAEHLIACDAHGITPKYRDGELDILEELVNNKVQKGK